MTTDLISRLLPSLRASREAGFNVFDVMHHGTHEKQLSNVFKWLLDTDGSHHLGGAFQRIFLEEVNKSRSGGVPFGPGPYVVRQEVNTAEAGDGGDIADLVLKSDDAVLVVENYVTSDGHGHSYGGYLAHGRRQGREQVGVVLLCRDHDSSAVTDGWEQAAVVTYGALVDRLHQVLSLDLEYQQRHPEPFSFIEQMHRKYARGTARMEDRQVLDFIEAMCATGEAVRYQAKSADLEAQKFAADVEQQARERFVESRELLQRIKYQLKAYSSQVLREQLNATLGSEVVTMVSARYNGIYQWTVNFDLADDEGAFGEAALQLKFGPSAWYANEADPHWTSTTGPGEADYSHLFLTRATSRDVRQSAVTLQEVLDGLSPDDRRLHDEIINVLRPRS